ncbi:MAG: barstar family protein [Clostridiales bacterium]|nr:barstar family protein [Clostridiales bacterium]
MKYQVDAFDFVSKQETHAVLRNALGEENYRGSNLDALHDCLTMIFEPTTLVISHWGYAERRLGEYADRLWHVLDDSSEENPFLTIILE